MWKELNKNNIYTVVQNIFPLCSYSLLFCDGPKPRAMLRTMLSCSSHITVLRYKTSWCHGFSQGQTQLSVSASQISCWLQAPMILLPQWVSAGGQLVDRTNPFAKISSHLLAVILALDQCFLLPVSVLIAEWFNKSTSLKSQM